MPWLLYKHLKKCVRRDKLEHLNSSGQGTRQAGSPSKQAPRSRLAGSRLSASRRCQNCEAGAAPRRRGRSPRRASTKSSCCRRGGFRRGGREGSRGTWTRSCLLQTQRARTRGWTWNPVMTQDNIFQSVSSVWGARWRLVRLVKASNWYEGHPLTIQQWVSQRRPCRGCGRSNLDGQDRWTGPRGFRPCRRDLLGSCSAAPRQPTSTRRRGQLDAWDIFNWKLLIEKRVSPEDPPSDRDHPHNDGDHEHDVVHHVATKLAETASHVIAASLTRDYEWLHQFHIKYRPPGCSWCTSSTWRWLSEGGGADRCRCHQESASMGCLALLGSRGSGRQVQQPGSWEDQDIFSWVYYSQHTHNLVHKHQLTMTNW